MALALFNNNFWLANCYRVIPEWPFFLWLVVKHCLPNLKNFSYSVRTQRTFPVLEEETGLADPV